MSLFPSLEDTIFQEQKTGTMNIPKLLKNKNNVTRLSNTPKELALWYGWSTTWRLNLMILLTKNLNRLPREAVQKLTPKMTCLKFLMEARAVPHFRFFVNISRTINQLRFMHRIQASRLVTATATECALGNILQMGGDTSVTEMG